MMENSRRRGTRGPFIVDRKHRRSAKLTGWNLPSGDHVYAVRPVGRGKVQVRLLDEQTGNMIGRTMTLDEVDSFRSALDDARFKATSLPSEAVSKRG